MDGAREIKFWDRSKRLDWFFMRAVAQKVLARPEILAEMRDCIKRNWGGDGSKARSLRLWRRVLALSPEEFAQFVLSDAPDAEETRESFPPYVALTPSERAEIIKQCRLEPVL